MSEDKVRIIVRVDGHKKAEYANVTQRWANSYVSAVSKLLVGDRVTISVCRDV